ncbi:unnamed protein product [Rotaria socialis]|uniref:Uncharacterized protein n=2 Tax=Rotaria socialis TaxID=392032 RepID=A0A818VWQ4_9BILA|nr:unnamed protein product [Rotaria socialis]CAF3614835.1 unnamed protein product [Rotaria socialis]CAF3717112.1 unnamed protein product [Rotaria socialis]
MNGSDTIITMLETHFRIPENKIHRLHGICNFLLSGLRDQDHEKRLDIDDMKTRINELARLFVAHNQLDFATIYNDLWTLLLNWWNTATWARREIRVPTEKGDLLGDLFADIVDEITEHFGRDGMKQHYKPVILKALIQMDTKGKIFDRYLRQKTRLCLPSSRDLDNLLQYYRNLSTKHGFDNRTSVFLQFLLDKKTRNNDRHSDNKIKEYQQCCQDSEVPPSFRGYIGFRGLDIEPQLFNDYERLFQSRCTKINDSNRN